jgi:phenylalanyl-tRNA synthetase beta chain
MKAPLSWIREYVDLPADVTIGALTDRLTMLGLKLEAITNPADAITGPLVVGRVLSLAKEPQKNGKTINWCTVDVADANGTGEPQGIVCGAHNFVEGDLVVVCLPGAVLPGNFEISSRKTYGHLSAGMICSAAELGLGADHEGIIVLPPDAGAPGDDAFEVLGMDDPVIEFEINPDRAYALSLRGSRGRRRSASACRSPTRPCGRPQRPMVPAIGSWSRTRPAAPCSWPARSAASTRRRPPPPGWRPAWSRPACGRSRWPSTSPTTSCSSSVGPSTATTPTSSPARSVSVVRARGSD